MQNDIKYYQIISYFTREGGEDLNAKNAVEKYAESLERKTYLSDEEGSAYTGMSTTAFRSWSKAIGARRKLGAGTKGKVVNVRSIIDQKIMEGIE